MLPSYVLFSKLTHSTGDVRSMLDQCLLHVGCLVPSFTHNMLHRLCKRLEVISVLMSCGVSLT